MNELDHVVEQVMIQCGKTKKQVSVESEENIKILIAEYSSLCEGHASIAQYRDHFLREIYKREQIK